MKILYSSFLATIVLTGGLILAPRPAPAQTTQLDEIIQIGKP